MKSIPRTIAKKIHDILVPRGVDDLFPEIAFSLYAFVTLLYRTVRGTKTPIWFISREGQPLMRLYEMYRGGEGDPSPRYLEVSRRSTFLPSLGPLHSESFERLFRQYWAISVWDFLASLGLERYAVSLQDIIGLDEKAMRQRVGHLPSSPLFRQLIQSRDFQCSFEEQRAVQRKALLDYLATFYDGGLPEEAVVVDVGWKGTIQDNLFALFSQEGGGPRCIKGYYVGLIESGYSQEKNIKAGLLFSCIGHKSRYFPTFNESRALFEVLLAADHASVSAYECLPSGRAQPIRAAFEEQSMVSEHVVPIQSRFFRRFSELCEVAGTEEWPVEAIIATASEFHARMVFRPSKAERQWFSNIFHVENFGVFERSCFSSDGNGQGLGERVRFVAGLSRRSNRLNLGFWPYLTVYEKGGPLPAFVYGLVRRLQS